MATQHQLSTCCRARVIRYGVRRRLCTACRRTWRLHIHKRGRDPLRPAQKVLEYLFIDHLFTKHIATRYPALTHSAVQKRVRRAIEQAATKPRQYPPMTPAPVIIMDGLWYTFAGEHWILFIFLLKPYTGPAVILDPVLLPGKESDANWSQALATISTNLLTGIEIMVSDNFRSATVIARRRTWGHQLCHFHLLAELRRKRGKRKKTIPARALREEVYQTITRVLYEPNEGYVLDCIKRLKELAADPACPTRFSYTIGEFVRRHTRYRTYLQYPELPIPTTTNAIESLNKQIRKHTRHLRTPRSVALWATAFVRTKQTINCNIYQPN